MTLGLVKKEPQTLCKDCKCRDNAILCTSIEAMEQFKKVVWNVITGEKHEGVVLCTDVNLGNCPYFDPK